MLENGTYATIAEIAGASKIIESYVGRVLRLTLLAPDIWRTATGRCDDADAVVRAGVDGAAEDINRLLTTFGGSP